MSAVTHGTDLDDRPSVAAIADALERARLTVTPIAQSSVSAPLGLATAYAVQHDLTGRRVASGDRIAGLKLGFTSRAKARQMGVDDVILGSVTDRMRIEDGGGFDPRTCIHPRIEPEIAYLLGADIDTDRVPDPAAIAAVAPALEIIDSRYRDFRFDLGDVIADNTSAAAYAIGPWVRPAEAGSFDNRAVRLEFDGRIVQTGSTSAILGDPGRALAAAARLARVHGFELRAGMILLAGAATVAVPVPRAGVVEATVAGLGRVSISIDGEGDE
ncbi:fumarylacetoacetate hydrolase family protein [Microbacterium sp. 2FI]|uniref:2-keto-4-pentenoate hydratase n=1 Tax=Microbacterium sp. 2FI TaxID=2502193 RepID=UPI0010F623CA|nr:fumarylacetoacetate hydrolase family protein [Microbacterium sp. 2FI]